LIPDGLTVADWFASVVARRGDAPALQGIDTEALGYRSLHDQIVRAGDALHGWGLGRQDVVLIAVPDGPAALWAFLAVSRVATAFPVPVHDQPEEYARLVDLVNAKAIVMEERPNSPLAALARERDLTLVHLVAERFATRGGFRLIADREACGAPMPMPSPDDLAVLTLISGTSATPKIVGSSQTSLHTSIRNFVDSVGVRETDRALCVMPIIHLHGLSPNMLSALLAGGSVVCAPGFDRKRVLHWIDRFKPTYMTAVPSVHRMVLQELEETGWRADDLSLRLIGIGSDRVDRETVDSLHAAFGVPVFQFYGVTETCPLIAMTPVRDGESPPGSAGRVNSVWGVRCVDESGADVPAGSDGEIIVKGGIINSIVGDPGAHPQVVTDGWFHTRDVGHLDADGFLFITGRLGDRIVRGGKKIEPQAVEEAIGAHAAVKQVVAFGLPDPVLGQRVASVVELVPGHGSNADEILAFAASRLTAYMVPEHLFIVDRIPTSSRGKVSRQALTEQFASLSIDASKEAVTDATDGSSGFAAIVLEIFRETLDQPEFQAGDDFFDDGGGDSLAVLSATTELEKRLGVSVPPATFQRRPSAILVAAYVGERARPAALTEIVPVRTSGNRPPLFLAHNISGNNSFATVLANALGEEQPVFTFHTTGVEPQTSDRSLRALASRYADLIGSVQPQGPYYLAGHSFGAQLAFEIAQRFRGAGETVAFLGLIDDRSDLDQRHFGALGHQPDSAEISPNNLWAVHCNTVTPYPVSIVYVRASDDASYYRSDPTSGWGYLADGGVDIIDIVGDHHSIVNGDGSSKWVHLLAESLENARRRGEEPVLNRLRPEKAEARSLVIDALVAAKRGDLSEEVALYGKAIEFDADQPFWVYGNLTEALFQADQIEEAIQVYKDTVRRDPWPLTSLFRFAPLLRRHKLKELMNQAADCASAFACEDASIAFYKGKFFNAIGRPIESEIAFQEGLRLDPDSVRILATYGRLLLKQSRCEESLTMIRRAISQGASLPDMYVTLSEVLLALNRLAEAEEAVHIAEKLKPPRAAVYEAISRVLTGIGRTNEADAARRMAVALSGKIDRAQTDMSGPLRPQPSQRLPGAQ
jgi:oxalate---CoA ligase